MLLVDTNVLSELAKKTPNRKVADWAFRVPLPIRVSVVTIEEVFFGLSWKPNSAVRSWFEEFFETSTIVVPATEAIARRAGELRGELRSRGHQRTQADMLIAATAQAHQLVLVTRNGRDFEGCGIPVLDPFGDL